MDDIREDPSSEPLLVFFPVKPRTHYMVSGRVKRGNTRRVGNCGISRPTRIWFWGCGSRQCAAESYIFGPQPCVQKGASSRVRRKTSRCKDPGSGVDGGGVPDGEGEGRKRRKGGLGVRLVLRGEKKLTRGFLLPSSFFFCVLTKRHMLGVCFRAVSPFLFIIVLA